MAEMFEDLGQADEFSLPGDEEYRADWEGSQPDEAVQPAAEPAPAAAPAAVEPPADGDGPGAAVDRPRGEDGKFLSAEEAARREAEAASAAAVAPAEGDLILGKFKSQEDLEAAYANLEREFHARNGELGKDSVADLAAEVAARLEAGAAAREPQAQVDPDELQYWFAENPTQIPAVAAEAHRRGDVAVRDAAIAAWEDVDKVEAKRFERAVIMDELERKQHAELGQAEQVRSQWQAAGEKFAQSHPDLAQHAEAMRALAGEFPDITKLLVGGTEQVQQQVLEFLYTNAKARTSDNLSQAAQDLGREQALGAEEAIREASVASSATTAVADAPSAAVQIAAEWDKESAPLDDGWQV